MLRIRQSKVPRLHQSLDRPSHLAGKTAAPPSLHIALAHNAVSEFINAVKGRFDDALALFYDERGGRVVGLVFNPILDKPRRWTVNLDFPTKPVVDEAETRTSNKSKALMVVLDRQALLAGILRLGSGLIDSVDST